MLRKQKYNEYELVALIKSGNRSSFNILYKNYSAVLYGIIFRIVKSEQLAQDVLQDTFVKIWKNIESFDSIKGTIFTWMLNIARNTAIDATRSKHEQNKIHNQELLVSIDNKSDNEIPSDHIGLKEMINTLRPEQKIIIEYLYLSGYTQEETASHLNIPLGTVKTRARSAILQLRKQLAAEQSER